MILADQPSIFENFLKAEVSGEVMSSCIVMLIIAVLAIIIGIQARNQDPLKKPKGLLLVAELGVKFFDNFVEGMIGNKIPGFGGVIMAMGVYLFLAFIFGLTGLPSPITYMAVPFTLGLTTFLMIHFFAIKFQKWGYFKRYIDPFPVFLPINLLSMWAPLLSLTLRMFGNGVAGFTIMTLIHQALYNLLANVGTLTIAGESASIFGTVLIPIITPILHAYFDLFSGFIQTTVFLSLTVIFVGQELPQDE